MASGFSSGFSSGFGVTPDPFAAGGLGNEPTSAPDIGAVRSNRVLTIGEPFTDARVSAALRRELSRTGGG